MVKRVFIYGQFVEDKVANSPLAFLLPPPPETGLSTEAIEILREPSVLELIGKVYVLTSSRNYEPVTPLGVLNFEWYKKYRSATQHRAQFYFSAKNGDLWHVPWMRQESDDAGSYIAVALKHA